MVPEQSTAVSGSVYFGAVLDETCERLWDTKVRYTLRRIGELDAALAELEQALGALLSPLNPGPAPAES
jgi:hypothetical protein